MMVKIYVEKKVTKEDENVGWSYTLAESDDLINIGITEYLYTQYSTFIIFLFLYIIIYVG